VKDLIGNAHGVQRVRSFAPTLLSRRPHNDRDSTVSRPRKPKKEEPKGTVCL